VINYDQLRSDLFDGQSQGSVIDGSALQSLRLLVLTMKFRHGIARVVHPAY
jgi:hypothetical protein